MPAAHIAIATCLSALPAPPLGETVRERRPGERLQGLGFGQHLPDPLADGERRRIRLSERDAVLGAPELGVEVGELTLFLR